MSRDNICYDDGWQFFITEGCSSTDKEILSTMNKKKSLANPILLKLQHIKDKKKKKNL